MFQNKAGLSTSTSASSSSGKTCADLPYGVAPNVHGSFKSCSGKVEVESRPNVSYADRKANAEAMLMMITSCNVILNILALLLIHYYLGVSMLVISLQKFLNALALFVELSFICQMISLICLLKHLSCHTLATVVLFGQIVILHS